MKVCIFWGRDKYQRCWNRVLGNAGVALEDVSLYTIPGVEFRRPTARATDDYIGLAPHYENFEPAPPGPVVCLSPNQANHLPGLIPLMAFHHPEDAVYVFGADQYSLHRDFLGNREIRNVVYIPGEEVQAHVAAAIVLYDRNLKAWAR